MSKVLGLIGNFLVVGALGGVVGVFLLCVFFAAVGCFVLVLVVGVAGFLFSISGCVFFFFQFGGWGQFPFCLLYFCFAAS